MNSYRRHPAEVTADRLKDTYERYYDILDGRDRDDISRVIQILEEIAEAVPDTQVASR